MKIDIMTLFPEMLQGPLNESIMKRAQDKHLVRFQLVNIRDFADNKHRTVDDEPFGGGPGMIMQPQPVFSAVEAAVSESLDKVGLTGEKKIRSGSPRIILMSPQGRVFKQSIAAELAQEEHLILVCGHYEGIDERIREHCITDELSIGDYVLTGGELAAMVICDAVVRLVPGVLGDHASVEEESFSAGMLEYPQYTRPRDFRGWKVPDVLLSGNHAAISKWRRQQALQRTRERRPDLFQCLEDKK